MKKDLNNIVIISGSVLFSGIIWYLYHPLMLRYLTLEEFAEFESLLSLLNIAIVIFVAVSLFFVKEISQNATDSNWIYSLSKLMIKRQIFLWLLLWWFFIFVSPIISNFLQIDYYWYFILLWWAIFIASVSIFQVAYFQGVEKFHYIAIFNVMSALCKLWIWFLLVSSWFYVGWALWWIVFSMIFIFIIKHIVITKMLENEWPTDMVDIDSSELVEHFLPQRKQMRYYLISSVLLAFLMNTDVLIAKSIFDANIAWTYVGISILAKASLFLWISIETVYYPKLVESHYLDFKSLMIPIALYIILMIMSFSWNLLFWDFFLNMFHEWFELHVDLLSRLLLFSGLLALLNLLVKLLIAFKSYRALYLISWLSIFCLIYLLNYQNDMYHLAYVINILMIFSILITIIELYSLPKRTSNII